MKRYAAISLAAAVLLYSAGCSAVSRIDIPEDEQAYSRILYPEGEYPDETDEEYDEFEYDYDYFEDETEHGSEEKEEKPAEKNNDTKSEKKTDKKNDKSSKSSKSSNTSSKNSSASSKVTSNSSKSSKRTVYRQSDLKKTASNASASLNSSKTSSDSDIDTDTELVEKPQREESPKGTFRESDLSYNAKKDYLDFDDDERFIYDVMGEPLSVEVSSQNAEKKLFYEDCEVTLRMKRSGALVLVDIFVPSDSFYTTFKGIATESKAEQVIAAYGDPTEIKVFYPDGYEPPEPKQEEDTEQESEPQLDSEASEDASDEEQTDAEDGEEELSEPEQPVIEPLYELYIYSIDDKSLIFRIEKGEVTEIEYKWNAEFI